MSINHCPECSPTCFQTVDDKCIESTTSSDKLQLKGGEALSTFNKAVANKIKEICDRLDMQMNTGSTPGSFTSVDTFVTCGDQIINRSFTYSVGINDLRYTVGYDLGNIISNLPPGFNLIRARTIAYSDGSIIHNSDKISTAVSATLAQLPIAIDFDLRINAPCGIVNLCKTVAIFPTSRGEVKAVMNTCSSSTEEITSQDEFNQSVSNSINQLRSIQDLLDTLMIPGCSQVVYPANDLVSVLSTQSSALCDLYDKAADVPNIQVQYQSTCENCPPDETLSITELFNKLLQENCDLKARLDSAEERLDALERSI